MKAAISIPDNLFLTIEEMAKKLNVSRSQFISYAVKEYIAKQNNRELFETLNKVYSEIDTNQEVKLRKEAKKHYSKLCEGEKW